MKCKLDTFTPIDISNAFKSVKIGKACGVDGVSAEHFLYAHDILHVFLSLLFTSFITHGHLPSNFMKTALVPIKLNTKQVIPVTKIIIGQLL